MRRDFPTIGLATVYNTLRSMTERGLVSELPFVNATRFDVNVTPHANLVCNRCGAIEDAVGYDEMLIELRDRIAGRAGFSATTQRPDIYGLCRSCASKAKLVHH